jgi:hypothetical protein
VTIDHIAAVAFFIFSAGMFVGLGVSLYDRAERRQAIIDVLTHAARCETAARISTAKESKAHEHANAARHAANDCKDLLMLMEGLHDCLKRETVDLTPLHIDPQGRTGEMGHDVGDERGGA